MEEGGRKGRRGVRAQIGTVHHDKQSTFGAVINNTHSEKLTHALINTHSEKLPHALINTHSEKLPHALINVAHLTRSCIHTCLLIASKALR